MQIRYQVLGQLEKVHVTKGIYMKNNKITVLLIILALLSLFTGIRINGEYGFLYQYTFRGAPVMFYYDMLYNKMGWPRIIHWVLLFSTNLALLILPFIYDKMKNRNVIIYIPLLFAVLASIHLSLFSFILIPFMTIWVILIIVKKVESNKDKQVK